MSEGSIMKERESSVFIDGDGKDHYDYDGNLAPEHGSIVSEYNGALSLLYGTKKTGLSKSGKRWYRWDILNATYFTVRSGQMRVYRKVKGNRRAGTSTIIRDVTTNIYGFSLPSIHSKSGPEFYSRLNRILLDSGYPTINPDDEVGALNGRHQFQTKIFPALSLNASWRATPGIHQALIQGDARSMLAASLGKSRVRKDVVKALADSRHLTGLSIASAIKTVAPIDWLIPLVGARIDTRLAQPKELKIVLGRVGERQRRLLIKDLAETRIAPGWIDDTIRMIRDLPEIPRGDDWQTLHAAVAPQYNRIERHRDDEEIPQKGVTKKLDGLDAGTMKLVSAKKSSDLWDWGDQMSHCIGSYDGEAVRGASHLFGLFDGGKMIANLELSPSGHIRQFYGRFNASPTEAVRSTVQKAIKERLA